jgi:HlyD family secretion protein
LQLRVDRINVASFFMNEDVSKVRRWGWWLGLAAVIAVGGFLVFRPPPSLAVVTARAREVVEVVVVSGQLRAVREARVGVEVGGTVEEVAVREGDRVAAGAVLARLRLFDFEQQLAQAEARRLNAEKELALAEADRVLAEREAVRIGRLFAQTVVSEDEQDRATAGRARAVAAVEAARARLNDAGVQIELVRRQADKREVRAPFEGLVVRRLVEPGQSVTTGEALLWIAETAQQEIYVETDENNLAKLRAGQRAIVAAPAFRNRPFEAVLTQIGPRVDWDRGLIGLRLTPGTLPDYARPNMTVDVSIESNRWSGAPALPAAAVLRERTGAAVLVVEGDRLIRRPVTVLGENPQWIAVEGLAAGAQVAANAAGAQVGRRYRFVAAATP